MLCTDHTSMVNVRSIKTCRTLLKWSHKLLLLYLLLIFPLTLTEILYLLTMDYLAAAH